MPYTQNSKANLIKEGISQDKIFVTGNPINEVIITYYNEINTSNILEKLKIIPRQYILATMHRAENVDIPSRLTAIIESLSAVSRQFGKQVIVSTHPRTREKISKLEFEIASTVSFLDPFGFFDFVKLEKEALCVISDSGTVQEECCILKIPNITIRDNTERPETIEVGSNILVGVAKESVCRGVSIVTQNNISWNPPLEYQIQDVSSIILKIILGK